MLTYKDADPVVLTRPTSIRAVYYWIMALVALVPGVVKLLCYPHNIGSDDAYIHLRIASNFARGLGWGINVNQPVNLSTSPGFTLLLAAAEKLTSHPVPVVQVLSVAATAAGLILIFFTALRETQSIQAALLAEIAAAFSVNLWRWNGSLMEASFAFTLVALILYLLRRDALRTPLEVMASGLALGVGLLLRPEIGILLVLAFFVLWMRSERSVRVRNAALLLTAVFVVVVPWCLFAAMHLGSIVPTTLASKSTTHMKLFNEAVLQQFAECLAESVLFPTILMVYLLIVVRRRPDLANQIDGSMFILPLGWVLGLLGFYYLKTSSLQSAGRYLLPLLPAEVMLIALGWAWLEKTLTLMQRRTALVFVGLHIAFAFTLNYKVVMPVLAAFESQYGDTMRAAAEELARQLKGKPNNRVLVEVDFGVLSCAANGRFKIYDGAALGTPELRGLNVRAQIQQVHPAFILQTLAQDPVGYGSVYPDLLSEVWERRFMQHGVRSRVPYFYTILFSEQDKTVVAQK